MRCTFKTVFYVNGSKERNGIVPIMGRVTINGTIAQFSCKQSVTKAIWDAKGNRATGKSKEAKEVNFALDNIKAQIAKHYQRLSDREAFVTAEMVRNAYQGIGTEYETLLKAFDKENAAFAKRVGKDRAKNTYNKYLVVRKYVAEFIKYQYKRSDMSMNELTEEFIRDYCLYLKNVVGLTQSTIWIYSIPLKHIVTAAHYNGKRNPFAMYHVDPDHKEREFLILDELTAMAEIKLEDPNMAFARDLFLFGCWTGISFIDIKNLTEDNLSMINGAPWIVSKRQKSLLEKFKYKLDWHKLTSNSSPLLFTEDNIEAFKDYWDWKVLSDKPCIDMTHELLIKYADRWNWAYIIDRYGDNSITLNEEFLEKYGEYIPASELGGSRLWDCIIEQRIKVLKKAILS